MSHCPCALRPSNDTRTWLYRYSQHSLNTAQGKSTEKPQVAPVLPGGRRCMQMAITLFLSTAGPFNKTTLALVSQDSLISLRKPLMPCFQIMLACKRTDAPQTAPFSPGKRRCLRWLWHRSGVPPAGPSTPPAAETCRGRPQIKGASRVLLLAASS
jgi:hypothetical protein